MRRVLVAQIPAHRTECINDHWLLQLLLVIYSLWYMCMSLTLDTFPSFHHLPTCTETRDIGSLRSSVHLSSSTNSEDELSIIVPVNSISCWIDIEVIFSQPVMNSENLSKTFSSLFWIPAVFQISIMHCDCKQTRRLYCYTRVFRKC